MNNPAPVIKVNFGARGKKKASIPKSPPKPQQ